MHLLPAVYRHYEYNAKQESLDELHAVVATSCCYARLHDDLFNHEVQHMAALFLDVWLLHAVHGVRLQLCAS